MSDVSDLSCASGCCGSVPTQKGRPADVGVVTRDDLRLLVGGVLAVGAELLAWAGMGEDGFWTMVLAGSAILVSGLEVLQRGWVALRRVTLNIHFLMSLAVLGAMGLGQWPEAAMVIFLFAVAERIEARSLDRARNAVRELMTLVPETVTVRTETEGWVEVPAAQAVIGTVARVIPGERIALDGEVISGCSHVNQAPITGESLPVAKGAGDKLFAGSINGEGVLEYRINADWRHSTLARIIDTVHQAQAKRAPMQRFVDRFARYYTPAVVAIAVGIAVIPPLLLDGAVREWVYNALVMLVVSCPCALVISTPVTVVSGLAAGAKQGILIKGGLYLEQVSDLKRVALDKTGTLTRGQLTVSDLHPLPGQDPERMLQIAASLDGLSSHPVAVAIVAALGDRLPLLEVREFQALAGRGVRGVIADTGYTLGNHRFLKEQGLCTPEVEALLRPLEKEEKSVVVLASSQAPLAVIAVSDRLREGAVEAVQALRAMGITVTMLTGDNAITAQAVAAHAGITDVRAELLPDEKWMAVDAMRQAGVVAMVGDGINDAPALAGATIGIAMGASGTDTAMETADVAIMNDDLRKVADFVRLGRATRRLLWQNIVLALGIKGTFLILSGMGLATLWMAVLADMGTSLLVILNGRRLLRFH
ncbi:MAG: heavy metal translocating P-type ATPase [Magnetococcales bacterium]|nr:heavy metal translocating P-type ATPase [Magnetococcales bacterium]NGZ06772.1 heavy metal translocating P-type ATPase [Magnetococcales bacterium]